MNVRLPNAACNGSVVFLPSIILLCLLGLPAPANFQTSSTELKPGHSVKGTIVSKQNAVFTAELAAGDVALLELIQTNADLTLEVKDPSGMLIVASNSTLPLELAAWRAPVDGRYKVFVRFVGGSTNSGFELGWIDGPQTDVRKTTILKAFERSISGKKKIDPLNIEGLGNALSDLRESREEWQKAGVRSGVASATIEIAAALIALGELETAYSELRKFVGDAGRSPSLVLAKDSVAFSAAVHNLLTVVCLRTSRFKDARFYGGLASAEYALIKDLQGQAEVVMLIGNYYASVAEFDAALAKYNEGIELWKKLGNQHRIAASYNNIGLVYFDMGEKAKAIKYYELSLATFRADRPNTRGEANVLSQLGFYYLDEGDAKRAEGYFELGLPIWSRITDPYGEPVALVGAGTAKAINGEKVRSRELLEKALSLSKSRGARSSEAAALFGIAMLERTLGDLAASRKAIESAIAIVESTREAIVEQQLRVGYFSRTQKFYDFYVDLLVEAGDHEAAFAASERSRARALVEMIASMANGPISVIDPKINEQETALRRRLNTIEQARATAVLQRKPAAVVDKLAADIELLKNELDAVINEISIRDPNLMPLVSVDASPPTELQRELLDPETVLLEFKLGEVQSHLFIVSDRSIRSVRLAGREVISTMASDLVRAISKPTTNADQVKQKARELGETLLGRAVKDLDAKRLLIVADGPLQGIPFGALIARDERYLMETFEIVILPSAEALLAVRRSVHGPKPASSKVLIVADPVFRADDPRLKVSVKKGWSYDIPEQKIRDLGRLPGTRREARDIALALGSARSRSLLDTEALRSEIMRADLRDYSYLHFATHGILSTSGNDRSGIVLSRYNKDGDPQENLLSIGDVYRLRLNAELTVLSSCESGLGRDLRGEGIVGLNRAFLFAGAKRVVSTLWKVDDIGTSDLMRRMYTNLASTSGETPAAALRRAQLEMIKSTRFSSPYYWSSFTITGEWR